MNKALTAITKVIGVVVLWIILWFVLASIITANPALMLVAVLISMGLAIIAANNIRS